MTQPVFSEEEAQRSIRPLSEKLYRHKATLYTGEAPKYSYNEADEPYMPPVDEAQRLISQVDGMIDSQQLHGIVTRSLNIGSRAYGVKKNSLIVQEQFTIPETITADNVYRLIAGEHIAKVTFGRIGLLQPAGIFSGVKNRVGAYAIDENEQREDETRLGFGLAHMLSIDTMYSDAESRELNAALDETRRLAAQYETEMVALRQMVDEITDGLT